MNLPRLHLGLPVLGKELIEQSNRKRTYIIRFLYAVLLFGGCAAIMYFLLAETRDRPVELLGTGRWMFEFLFWVQIGGVYLLLPAMLAGAITVEKERNTLHLLLLTSLSPWEILLQKLLSRVVVVGTFVLLNLPLLAITYAFGGVSGQQLFLGMYALALTCLQVGGFSIMCSAFFRTTAAAFIASYIGLGAIYLFLPFVYAMLWEFGRYYRASDEEHVVLLPMYGYLTRISWSAWSTPPRFSVVGVLIESWPVWLMVAVTLLAGRWYLTCRAMLRPWNPVLALFRWLDRVFTAVNERVAGGIEIIRSRVDLPDDRPVAWLERTRRAIARPHYLIRLFVATSIPVLFLCLFLMFIANNAMDEAFPAMVFLLWPVLVLWLAILAAGTFASERSGQTLDVLMTTPLETRQVLREKVSALWRFAMVIALPLAIVIAFESYIRVKIGDNVYRPGGNRRDAVGPGGYIFLAALSLLVYIPLVVWISVWLGMWVKTRVRAAMAAVAVVIVLCLWPFFITVPMILAAEFAGGGFSPRDEFANIMMGSPLLVVPSLEFNEMPFQTPWVQKHGAWGVLGVHFAVYALLALGIRAWCYRSADRLLGRVAGRGATSDPVRDTMSPCSPEPSP